MDLGMKLHGYRDDVALRLGGGLVVHATMMLDAIYRH